MTTHSKLSPFRRSTWPFDFILLMCAAFLFLTMAAMAFYPGGTALDRHSRGYEFFVNFFSDLGRTQARGGAPNPVSSELFFVALSGAGAALGLFFLSFAPLIWGTLVQRISTGFGVAFGLISAANFVGVALFPADLHPHEHVQCVLWAFRLFPLAIAFFALSILMGRSYPRAGVWIFVTFALGLLAYVALITVGPSPLSQSGLMIQATGQKLVVYASLLSVGAQSLLARRHLSAQQASKSSL